MRIKKILSIFILTISIELIFAKTWSFSGIGSSDTACLKITVADTDFSSEGENSICIKENSSINIVYNAEEKTTTSTKGGSTTSTSLFINDNKVTDSNFTYTPTSDTTKIELRSTTTTTYRSSSTTSKSVLEDFYLFLLTDTTNTVWAKEGTISYPSETSETSDYSLKVTSNDGKSYWTGETTGYVAKGAILNISYTKGSISWSSQTNGSSYSNQGEGSGGSIATALYINGKVYTDSTITFTVTDNTVIKLGEKTSADPAFWTLTLTCDGTAPTLHTETQCVDDTSKTFVSEEWINSDIDFILTGSDEDDGSGLKGYEVSSDGGSNYTFQTSDTYEVTTEGETDVSFEAIDNVENVSDESTYSVKIDKTDPIIESVSAIKDEGKADAEDYVDGEWSTKAVTYTIKAKDGLSGLTSVTCSDSSLSITDSSETDDNGYSIYTSKITANEHDDFYFLVTDAAGNTTTLGPYTVKVDTVTPVLSKTGVTVDGTAYNEGDWTNQNVTLSIKPTIGSSGVQKLGYSTDSGSSWTTLSSETDEEGDEIFSLPVTVESGCYVEQTIYFYVTNGADVTVGKDKSISYEVKIDKISPTIDLSMGADSEDSVYYLNEDTLKSTTFVIADQESGIDSFDIERDGTSISSGNENKTFTYGDEDNPIEKIVTTGEYPYIFTASDNANNETTTNIDVLYDTSAIDTDDINLEIGDKHQSDTQITSDKYSGNITNFTPLVKEQGSGTAPAASFSLKVKNSSGTLLKSFSGSFGETVVEHGSDTYYQGTFTSDTDISSYIKENISDGEYSVTVTITDKCGNVSSEKEFSLTFDRSVLTPTASWITIETDADGNQTWSITPTCTDKEGFTIYSYDNSDDFNSEESDFTGTEVYSNTSGDVSQKSSSISITDEKEELYLIAVDAYNNYAKSKITIVDPDDPGEIAFTKYPYIKEKTDSSLYEAGFDLSLTDQISHADIAVSDKEDNENSLTVGITYYGQLYDSTGETTVGDAVAAEYDEDDKEYKWDISDLKTSGERYYFEVWAELDVEITDIEDELIVPISRTGTKSKTAIADSTPLFIPETITWPSYVGHKTSISCPAAFDPDGDSVYYRMKVESGDTIWYTKDSTTVPTSLSTDSLYASSDVYDSADAELQDTVESIIAENGATITIEAIGLSNSEVSAIATKEANGETTIDWSEDGYSIPTDGVETYESAKCDFIDPVASAETLWETGDWSNATSFTFTGTDSESGVNSIEWTLCPKTEEGESDADRPSYTSDEITGATSIDGTSTNLVISDLKLTGIYELALTVTDNATNYDIYTATAKFDTTAPSINEVSVGSVASDGYISVTVGASDGTEDDTKVSGVNRWTWRQGDKSWSDEDTEWYLWGSSDSEKSVEVKPDWSDASSESVYFKVRDEAGNESDEFEGDSSASYEATVPDFSVKISDGLSGSAENGYYATDTDKLESSVSYSDEDESGDNLTESWGILICDGSEESVSVSGKASWESARSSCEWQDGSSYRIEVTLTNGSGVKKSEKSSLFTVETTGPSAITVTLEYPERRRSFYENEKITVDISGGTDDDTGANRTVSLYQRDGESETLINEESVTSGATSVQIGWGCDDIDWDTGNFYIIGKAENGAGLESDSEEVTVPVSGTGMTVYIPSYIAVDGSFGASWESSNSETESYEYSVYNEDDERNAILTGETEDSSVVIDLSDAGLEEGDEIYLEVKGIGSNGQSGGRSSRRNRGGNSGSRTTETGDSCSATLDGSEPTVEWTDVPEAVSSTAVMASFKAEDDVSGIEKIEWYAEKKDNDEWERIGESDEWNEYEGYEGSITADLSSYVESGNYVRLVLRAENGAEEQTTVWSEGIAIDDSAPPTPLIIDQGSVINYEKQDVTCNWQMSEKDPESGTSVYYWGWYYAGDGSDPTEWDVTGNSATNADEWTKITVNDESTSEQNGSISFSSDDTEVDGKTVVFVVKAKNGAGLETIGYSDGIMLDSTAPYICGIGVYTDSDKTTSLNGYVTADDIENDHVYIAIEDISEDESWVEGGSVQAYEIDGDGNRSAYGEEVELEESEDGSFEASVKISSEEGLRWVFEASVEDAGENKSSKAESDGFIIEGSIPGIADLEYSADANTINIDWSVDETGSTRWISGYLITVQDGNGTQLCSPKTTSCKAASYEWGTDGLDLSDGDTVKFTVSAYSYAGENSTSQTISITIDLTPPEYDEDNSKIPKGEDVTYWYDRITGHVQYESGRSGVGSIQWSAVMVPGEDTLVDWQEKESVTEWDIEKLFSAINDENLSWWQGKQIRIKMRAENGMGIWSETENTIAIEADTTDPEIAEADRDWAWTNESDSVDDWTIKAQDKQSGIIAYRIVVVPEDTDEDSYDWSDVSAVSVDEEGKDEAVELEDISAELTSSDEGEYKPLLELRNGSGHWSVTSGDVLTVDRTAPEIVDIDWDDCEREDVVDDGNEENVAVSNGPRQSYEMSSNEEVSWEISGESSWFTTQNYPKTRENEEQTESSYDSSAQGRISFGDNDSGYIYEVDIAMTDKAGNVGYATDYLRYNRAPQITVNTDNLTVWPGHERTLDDLVDIDDDEQTREGDYPLSYEWNPGNEDDTKTWEGGSTLSDVFGESDEYGEIYLQKSKRTQISYYEGSLTVTDRYGKSSTEDLTIKVENTREGSLLVDEYWSGEYEITGVVIVPDGLTLTMNNSEVEADGDWNSTKEVYESGFTIESGGTLEVSNRNGRSSIESEDNDGYWYGVTVEGSADISGLVITGAQRGFILESGGSLTIENGQITSCETGMHLLGGTLSIKRSSITDNDEYGIKEDSDGDYGIENTEIEDNTVNYYDSDKTVLTDEEIQGLEE